MSFDSFGYNGVLQASESFAGKLLATAAYESNLVVGDINTSDFHMIPLTGQPNLHMYLLTGKPTVQFTSNDGTNEVQLFIPLFGLGFYDVDAATPQKLDLGLGAQGLGLQVSQVKLLGVNDNFSIDFSAIVGDSIAVVTFAFVPKTTHVGGTANGLLVISDATLTTSLTNAGLQMTGAQLRAIVATNLQKNIFGPTTIHIDAGADLSQLKNWDLFTFDLGYEGSPEGGADLLLFAADGTGNGGDRADASNTIPLSDSMPDFHWAVSLRDDLLLQAFDAALSADSFFDQNENVPNTADKPQGFMVVPPAGTRTFSIPIPFSIPKQNGVLTLSASAGGNVTLTAPANTLSPNGRAHLSVVGAGAQNSFTVNGDGSTSQSIAASTGDRITLTMDAISTPGDSSVVVWRPKIRWIEGGVHFDFHYFKSINKWCDAEGDGSVDLQLSADRTFPFKVGITVASQDISLPWWAYVTAWFGGDIAFGLIGSVLTESLLITVIKNYILEQLNISSDINKIAKIDSIIKAPAFPDGCLFLDLVQAGEKGLVLAGRADAGVILAYGRALGQTTFGGIILQAKGLLTDILPEFLLDINWVPSAGQLIVEPQWVCSVITNDVVNSFWSFGYDDLPSPPYSLQTFPLDIGGSAMIVADMGYGLCKVLFERDASDTPPGTNITISWICYQKRVVQGVNLLNKVKRTLLSQTDTARINIRFFKYNGLVVADPVKFYLTDDTDAAGQEHWFWDGDEVTRAGLNFPGGNVVVQDGHQLSVNIDQTDASVAQSIVSTHTVKFTATDVFGNVQSAQLVLSTPESEISITPLAYDHPQFGGQGDPFRNKVLPSNLQLARQISILLSNQLPGSRFSTLNSVLSTSIATGTAIINQDAALLIVDLLIQKHRLPASGLSIL
jgi:hypothetical protein